MKMRDLEEEESKSYGAIPRTLDRLAFRFLIGQVTEYVMNQITNDWEACKQAISYDIYGEFTQEGYDCELLLRYSLPCKHYLLRPYLAGIPIPKELFHHWWLNGPPISTVLIPWKPHFSAPLTPSHTSQRLNDITTSGLQALDARDNLTGLAKAIISLLRQRRRY
jgi:hypothetical protein